MIELSQSRELLIETVRIPSPSGYEHDVASFLVKEMDKYGFESRIDSTGNVIGEIGNKHGPQVVLLGHIDTVPTLLPVTVTDHDLAGRGVVDATGSLCTFDRCSRRRNYL